MKATKLTRQEGGAKIDEMERTYFLNGSKWRGLFLGYYYLGHSQEIKFLEFLVSLFATTASLRLDQNGQHCWRTCHSYCCWNVGRFFMLFIEVAKLGNIVRQLIRSVTNLVIFMLL